MPRTTRKSESSSRSPLLLGVLAVVVVALAIGLGVFVTADGDDGGGKDDGSSFGPTALTNVAKPLADGLQLLVPALDTWRKDPAADTTNVKSVLDSFLTTAGPAATDLADVPAGGDRRRAKEAALVSVRLYRVFAELEKVAVRLPVDPLQTQVDLIARRVRVLADRIYDRVVLTLDDDAFDTSPDVEMRRPPDVPDWLTEGQAAGPPLDDEPPAPAEIPPIREAGRREQAEDDWIDEVAAAVTVDADAVADAFGNGDELRDLARDLAEIAVKLAKVADPSDGRERAALVRLGLLLQAEAARTGQAALLAPAGELRTELEGLARRLLVAGDLLWDPDLPARRSGLDRSVFELS
jgi:hypothetical protein